MIKKIASSDGNFYYYNDVIHREDGPAIEMNKGYKAWYHHGHLHRENGPAVEYIDGTKE